MLTAVTIKSVFDRCTKYSGTAAHIGAYLIPSLPLGHRIPTDNYLVLLIGDNGAGKTTFLKRLKTQVDSRYGINSDLLDLEYDGAKIRKAPLFSDTGQFDEVALGILSASATREERDRYMEEAKMSQGTNRLYSIKRFLERSIRRHPLDRGAIYLFDQPEDGVSLRRMREMVRTLGDFAFEKQMQLFVATHEPLFIEEFPDALVINMDTIPATTCKASEFDLEKYTGSMPSSED